MEHGGKASEATAPSKEGYSFVGWYVEDKVYDFATEVTGNLTLVGKYEINKYTVSFNDVEGNKLSESQIVEHGGKASEATAPSKEGYSFVGWYVEDKAYDFATEVTGNLTLIGKYEINKYTVRFYDMEGTELGEGQKVEHGTTVEFPVFADREGYKFLGWYVGEEKYDINQIVTSDLNLTAKWQYMGDIKEEDQEDIEKLENLIWVAGIEDVDYTGSKHTFELRVYDGNKLLTEGKDYSISYKNNTNAYVVDTEEFDVNGPQVILKMKGDYTGIQKINFNIRQLSVSENCIAQDISVVYNAKKVQEPKPVVIWNGKNLKKDKDYTVTVTKYATDATECKAAGTYEVTIDGKGNFTGSTTIKYVIVDTTEKKAISKLKIAVAKTIKFSDMTEGKAIPTVVVKDGKTTLNLNEDYEVNYLNNDKVGTAYAVITGKGNYEGSKTVSFKITGTSIGNIRYDKISSYTYTGKEIKPLEKGIVIKDKATGITLEKEKHFFVSYSKNVNKGIATMILTGNEKYGYTGTKKISFKITAATVKDLDITFAETGTTNVTTSYMKGGAKPVVIVKVGSTVLKEGKDYTVSYGNNKKATDSAKVIIKGKGNYADKKEMPFIIENKALNNENGIKVVAKDKVVSSKKNGYRQSFKVYDADGKALSASDYDSKDVIYEEVTLDKDGNVKEVIRTLDKKSVVEANSTIRITVKGKGVYAGKEGEVALAYGYYRIMENTQDIGKATVQIKDKIYTGQAITLEETDIQVTVTLKKGTTPITLTYGTDFEIVEGSYQKNVNKGTAKVTIKGIGNYAGEKTVSFKIVQRKVEENWWEDMMNLLFN